MLTFRDGTGVRVIVFAVATTAMIVFAPAARGQGASSNVSSMGTPLAVGSNASNTIRPWDVTARVSSDFDSNVGLEAVGKDNRANRTGFTAAGTYRLAQSGSLQAGVGGLFAQTLNAGSSSADDYNLTSVSPQLFASYDFIARNIAGTTQATYQFRSDWLKGDAFERSHSLRFSTMARPLARVETGFYYQVAFEQFDENGSAPSVTSRDATHHRVGIPVTFHRPAARQSLTLGYEHIANRARGRNFDFDADAVSARLSTPLPLPVALWLQLEAAYTTSTYINFTPRPRRSQDTQFYRALLSLPLRYRLTVDASYGYTHYGAKQSRFSTDRHAVGVGLSYQF